MAKKPWTDAEFDVVGNHYRPGEQHRDPKLKRWLFTGRANAWGTPLWYRRPRFTKLQLAGVLCAGVIGLWLLLLVAGAIIAHRASS